MDNQDVTSKEREEAMRKGLGSKLLDEMLDDLDDMRSAGQRQSQQQQQQYHNPVRDNVAARGGNHDEQATTQRARDEGAGGASVGEPSGAHQIKGRSDVDEGFGGAVVGKAAADKDCAELRASSPTHVAFGADAANDDSGDDAAVMKQPTSSNTLYAVMALVADLDLESLRIVQSEVEHRIEEALSS